MLQCVAVCCSVLQCVAVCCGVLRCVLRCVAGVLQVCDVMLRYNMIVSTSSYALSGYVCCSVLQRAVVCGNLCQRIAV